MNWIFVNRPSFLKVLIKDFTQLLQLPPDFSNKYGVFLSEIIYFRVSSGYTWGVHLEQTYDGQYCFTRGWTKFAEDAGLRIGEYLVFSFINKSVVDVSVFGITGCQREIRGYNHRVEDSVCDEQAVDQLGNDEAVELGKERIDEIACDVINNKKSKICTSAKKARNCGADKSDKSQEKTSPLYFEFLLKRHHMRLYVPKKFVLAAGLIDRETVRLEYLPKLSSHVVFLDSSCGYTLMTKGWTSFRRENGLVVGKMYSFEFKPSKNVIEVKELQREN